MSTAPEAHLLPPPKPKLSPLELRNTDLVSRLLAATPPYLYNMSLLPNTYFFSEMLRSLVQAKNEQRANMAANGFPGSNMFYGPQMRRARKRGWSGANREMYHHQNSAPLVEEKPEKHVEKNENESWMIKSSRRSDDAPVELVANPGNSSSHQKTNEHHKPLKLDDHPVPPFVPPQQENASNLVLPPPPPIWYPPIYPTPPYGIDPLHFFIDLRVSGHIYDRQNGEQPKETTTQEGGNSTIVSPKEDSSVEKKEVKIEEVHENPFAQKRHCSAFSVPNSSKVRTANDRCQTKFDVKSMGFDKSSSKTSTSYIMGNIASIYRNFDDRKEQSSERVEDKPNEDSEESEAEKQKKVKDLRALIGLELVVDYMSHKKGLVKSDESSVISDDGEISSEMESCESPPLEVVAVHDEV